MLTAYAPGERGHLLFLGFEASDLAHLTANQPLNVEAARLGLGTKPVVLLFETDPMVSFYASFPAVVILFRRSTLEALRGTIEGGAFVQLPLPHPELPPNTIAFMFQGKDDADRMRRPRAAAPSNYTDSGRPRVRPAIAASTRASSSATGMVCCCSTP